MRRTHGLFAALLLLGACANPGTRYLADHPDWTPRAPDQQMDGAEVLALLHVPPAGEFTVTLEETFLSRVEDDIWREIPAREVASGAAATDYTVVIGARSCSDWQWMTDEDYVGYQAEERSSWYLLRGDTLIAWDHWNYGPRCVPVNAFRPARGDDLALERTLLRFVAQRFPNPQTPAEIRFDRGVAYLEAGRIAEARRMLKAGDRAIEVLSNDRIHRERGVTRTELQAQEEHLRRRRAELSVAIDRAALEERGLPTAPVERFFRGVDD